MMKKEARVKEETKSKRKKKDGHRGGSMLTYARNDEKYSRSFGATTNQSTKSEDDCSFILLHNLHTEEKRERQEDDDHYDRDDSK